MPSWSARSRDISSVADAPSESCDELPAVTVPFAAGLVEVRLQREQAFERGVRAIAFVAVAQMLLPCRSSSPVFLSRMARVTFMRRDLILEKALGLRPRGALLAATANIRPALRG